MFKSGALVSMRQSKRNLNLRMVLYTSFVTAVFLE
jgi:hypothetical protein